MKWNRERFFINYLWCLFYFYLYTYLYLSTLLAIIIIYLCIKRSSFAQGESIKFKIKTHFCILHVLWLKSTFSNSIMHLFHLSKFYFLHNLKGSSLNFKTYNFSLDSSNENFIKLRLTDQILIESWEAVEETFKMFIELPRLATVIVVHWILHDRSPHRPVNAWRE